MNSYPAKGGSGAGARADSRALCLLGSVHRVHRERLQRRICAARASGAGSRRDGKEKVYGSIRKGAPS